MSSEKQIPSFDSHTDTVEQTGNRRRTLKQKIGATATAATLTAGTLVGINQLRTNAAEEAEQLQRERVAAEAIALGYNCEIIQIDDTHARPKGMVDSSLRSTVNVTLRMQKTPEAVPYFEQYKNDAAVQWLPLQPGGLMHVGANGETIPVTVSKNHNPDLVDLQTADPSSPASWEVTIPFYPRTEYPDETLVDIVMKQQVVTSDDETSYETTGIIPCGTMKIFNGVWGKSGTPTTLKPETHTEVRQRQ